MRNWYVAYNPKTFDIVTAMSERKSIFLPHPKVRGNDYNIQPGDRMYVYVSVGFAQIRYLLEVAELDAERKFYGIMFKYANETWRKDGRWLKCVPLAIARPAYKPLQCGAIMPEYFNTLALPQEIKGETLAYIEHHFDLAKI